MIVIITDSKIQFSFFLKFLYSVLYFWVFANLCAEENKATFVGKNDQF